MPETEFQPEEAADFSVSEVEQSSTYMSLDELLNSDHVGALQELLGPDGELRTPIFPTTESLRSSSANLNPKVESRSLADLDRSRDQSIDRIIRAIAFLYEQRAPLEVWESTHAHYMLRTLLSLPELVPPQITKESITEVITTLSAERASQEKAKKSKSVPLMNRLGGFLQGWRNGGNQAEVAPTAASNRREINRLKDQTERMYQNARPYVGLDKKPENETKLFRQIHDLVAKSVQEKLETIRQKAIETMDSQEFMAARQAKWHLVESAQAEQTGDIVYDFESIYPEAKPYEAVVMAEQLLTRINEVQKKWPLKRKFLIVDVVPSVYPSSEVVGPGGAVYSGVVQAEVDHQPLVPETIMIDISDEDQQRLSGYQFPYNRRTQQLLLTYGQNQRERVVTRAKIVVTNQEYQPIDPTLYSQL